MIGTVSTSSHTQTLQPIQQVHLGSSHSRYQRENPKIAPIVLFLSQVVQAGPNRLEIFQLFGLPFSKFHTPYECTHNPKEL